MQELRVGICSRAKRYCGRLDKRVVVSDGVTLQIREIPIPEENQKEALLREDCHLSLDLYRVHPRHKLYRKGKRYTLYLDIVNIVEGQVILSGETQTHRNNFRQSRRKTPPSAKQVLTWIQSLSCVISDHFRGKEAS